MGNPKVFALVESGVVINLIWLLDSNKNDFPNAILCDESNIKIGDLYDGLIFTSQPENSTPLGSSEFTF